MTSVNTATLHRAASAGFQLGANATTVLDRLLSPNANLAFDRPLTPVEQGELARLADADAAKGGATPRAARPVSEAGTPLRGISVASTVERRANGTELTTIYIDVKASFVIADGKLPSGVTAASEAKRIEAVVERDFTKSYTDRHGDTTRYVTRVDMRMATAVDPTRTNFVLVAASNPVVSGALGIAPGFENGNIAYVSDAAPARTAPHEFGHLAGLRHVASTYEGCVVPKGVSANNLMSQTGCAPTSHQIERSQLRQIYNTPVFRPAP